MAMAAVVHLAQGPYRAAVWTGVRIVDKRMALLNPAGKHAPCWHRERLKTSEGRSTRSRVGGMRSTL